MLGILDPEPSAVGLGKPAAVGSWLGRWRSKPCLAWRRSQALAEIVPSARQLVLQTRGALRPRLGTAALGTGVLLGTEPGLEPGIEAGVLPGTAGVPGSAGLGIARPGIESLGTASLGRSLVSILPWNKKSETIRHLQIVYVVMRTRKSEPLAEINSLANINFRPRVGQ